jgi:hypothetical protein
MNIKNENTYAYSYSYLDQLSAAEVFQLLTKAAKLSGTGGQHLEKTKIVFTGPMPFKYVALEVPDPYAKTNQDKEPMPAIQQGIFKILVDEFRDMTGRGERYDFPGGESKPLHEGIAWLMLHGADEEHDNKTGDPNEFLVVTRTTDEKEAEILFKNISFHATSTRVSTWEDKGSRYMFHVKDDLRRKSSFSSIAAGGMFDTCRVLKGFEIDGLITFLPPESPPGENKLRHFCRLVQEAPVLFGTREETAAPNLTAAILQWPDDELEFLYIGGIKFFRQEYFTGRKVRHVSFKFMDLKESSRSLERLGEAIKQAKPYVGYRLEIRPASHLDENSLERLHEQKARIEYNLAYLQTIMKPRPILMRFTSKQLPALAAEIRSFPMQAIYEGNIKYAFQATELEPTGYHFLLIDPSEISHTELDPLPLFRDLDIPRMQFHLDPFWARHYFEEENPEHKNKNENKNKNKGVLVFVPDGCALFPSIHNWNRGNMNLFLRETMEQWFHDRLKGESIPANPIYVFDGEPQPNAPIHVSVLDRNRFEPFHTRLGWINDNLIVHHTLEKEGLITELAKDITWGEVAQKIKINMEKTRRDFSDSALAATNNIAQTTNEMTNVLSNEIERIVKETFRMTQKIKKIDERLEEWDEILADMEDVLLDVRQERQNTSYHKGEAKNEFRQLEMDVEQELKYSEKTRTELEEKINLEILKMQDTAKRLKQRLKRFKL